MRARACPALWCLTTLIVFFCLWAGMQTKVRAGEWQRLQTGLRLQVFEPQLESRGGGESLEIAVLKIDPGRYSFHLLSTSENGETNRTLPQWMRSHNLLAVINASMFWKDQRTSTGFMKNFGHVNNSHIHPKYDGFLVFNPMHDSLPEIQIIDRKNTSDWRKKLRLYHTAIQNFRMISSERENVWEQNDEKYSVACVGMDSRGQVLFIFSQSPTTIHNLNNTLLQLPLRLQTCMFMEGGPTAGMLVNTSGFQQAWQGTSETFLWTEAPSRFTPLPNVIGITRKHEDTPCNE